MPKWTPKRESETVQLIRRTREYLDYVEEHYNNVQRAFLEVEAKLQHDKIIYDDFYYWALRDAVFHHDASKLSAEEFVQYRKKFYPCDFEEPTELGDAWEHHKQENAHHWENWTKHTRYLPDMWMVDCVHMVIDWMAMSYKFGGNAREWYDKNKSTMQLPEYGKRYIEEIFDAVYGPRQNER
jgi:hypothetical protein